MNIVVIGNFIYPFGTACASRIRLFAKGFIEGGATVRIICQSPIPERPEDRRSDGWCEHEGVLYVGAAGGSCSFREDRGVGSRLRWLGNLGRAHWVGYRILRDLIDAGKVDVVLGYARQYTLVEPVARLCRSRGTTFLCDVVEWTLPFFFSYGRLNPLYWSERLGLTHSVPKADGLICISSFLMRWYGSRGIPVLRVPAIITVPERTAPSTAVRPGDGRPFNITYLGQLSERDGPFELIEAVRIVAAKGLPVRLTIVGSAGLGGTARLVRKQCLEEPLLRDKVDFLGRVSDEEVVRRLHDANALVLSRPRDDSAEAAFPTRLPEYLLSGNPVIITAVGDIAEYLRRGIDAMVVEPGSAHAVAHAIEQLIAMPDWGAAIGASGRSRVPECFDYRKHTSAIMQFISQLHSE